MKPEFADLFATPEGVAPVPVLDISASVLLMTEFTLFWNVPILSFVATREAIREDARLYSVLIFFKFWKYERASTYDFDISSVFDSLIDIFALRLSES